MGIYGYITQVQITSVVKIGLGWKAKVGGGNIYLARPWYTGRNVCVTARWSNVKDKLFDKKYGTCGDS
jgi:hypothetical protein